MVVALAPGWSGSARAQNGHILRGVAYNMNDKPEAQFLFDEKGGMVVNSNRSTTFFPDQARVNFVTWSRFGFSLNPASTQIVQANEKDIVSGFGCKAGLEVLDPGVIKPLTSIYSTGTMNEVLVNYSAKDIQSFYFEMDIPIKDYERLCEELLQFKIFYTESKNILEKNHRPVPLISIMEVHSEKGNATRWLHQQEAAKLEHLAAIVCMGKNLQRAVRADDSPRGHVDYMKSFPQFLSYGFRERYQKKRGQDLKEILPEEFKKYRGKACELVEYLKQKDYLDPVSKKTIKMIDYKFSEYESIRDHLEKMLGPHLVDCQSL